MEKSVTDDIHFISYASNRQFPYKKSRKRLYEEAVIFDEFKTIKIYNEKDLGKSTRKHLNDILKHDRGGGYMIWKPVVIKRKLDSIGDGEFLIYVDCGANLNKNGKSRLWDYLNMASNSPFGTLCCDTGHMEKSMTKKEVFAYYDVKKNNHKIRNTGQYGSGHLFMQKKPKLVELINEWYDVAMKRMDLFRDPTDEEKQDKVFVSHRHDQSTFSVLRKLKGVYPVLMDPIPYHGTKIEDAILEPIWNLHIRE